VIQPDSPHLSIKRLTPTSGVAYGMCAEFEISFQSQSDEDYKHNLIVETEREKFYVPVVATGPSIEFDLPDTIDCGKSPIGRPVARSYLLTNVGSKSGSFRLRSDGDFVVEPTEGFLDPADSVRLNIAFGSETVGVVIGILSIDYGNGRHNEISLRGEGLALPVHLGTDKLLIDPTYISRSSSAAFALINDSATSVSFSISTGTLSLLLPS